MSPFSSRIADVVEWQVREAEKTYRYETVVQTANEVAYTLGINRIFDLRDAWVGSPRLFGAVLHDEIVAEVCRRLNIAVPPDSPTP